MKTFVAMRAPVLCFVALVLLLAWPATALGQVEEAPAYSWGSAQGAAKLEAVPGVEEAVGVVYSYNIDGNRITHLTFRAATKAEEAQGLGFAPPDGWTVEIDPALHDQEYGIGGGETKTVSENLYVEPGEVFAAEPTTFPADMVVLNLPGRLGPGVAGYALSKPAYVVVTMPKEVPKGITAKITIKGKATWLGQSGNAAIEQERDFTFEVATVYKITEETPIIRKSGSFWTSISGNLGRWMPVIVAVAVVIVAALVLPRFTLKRKA